MSLFVQFKTILFSFIFGCFFHFFLNINYKYIIRKGILSLFFNILFIIVNVLIYFLILKYINFGVFHIYEICVIIFGYLFYHLLCIVVEKKSKK